MVALTIILTAIIATYIGLVIVYIITIISVLLFIVILKKSLETPIVDFLVNIYYPLVAVMPHRRYVG